MNFTEGQLRRYETIMKLLPNPPKNNGRRKGGYTYSWEDCNCEYCLYNFKKTCTVEVCCLVDVIDCIVVK